MTRVSFIQKVMCSIIILVVIGGGFLHGAEAAGTPILYLFWGDGCSHCEKEKTFLVKDLQQRYPELEMRFFETWKHPEFKQLVQVIRQAYKIKRASVPLTLIGDWSTIGFGSPETTGMKIEEQVRTCLQEGCIDAIDKLGPYRVVAKIKDEAAGKKPIGWELYPAVSSGDE